MQALYNLLGADHSLVVTDTETTGLNARVNRIIEIASQRIAAPESNPSQEADSDWFSNLIHPGTSIPGNITRITGISTSMVIGQPSAEIVMPQYKLFLADSIFVAHNIRFDLSFINSEFARIGLDPIENQGLCSLKLARRLLPGLRSKSLGNLARFFKIPDQGRHRAARDVEITTLVLERLAQIAIDEHKVSSIDELISMQSRTYAKVNPFSKHVIQIRRDILPNLPQRPGVYYMRDGRGKILYVGKAKTLSQRVSSYFTAIEAHPPRLRQLISKVRAITWDPTDTELHALVLESRQIKEIDPPFNRAQKKYIPRPYLRINVEDPFPTLTMQVIVRSDGAKYYGPIRSRSQAKTLVEIIEKYFPLRTCSTQEFSARKKCVRADIGRCFAPCEGTYSTESYADLVQKVVGFLEGDIEEVCSLLELDMQRAAERMLFEEAAVCRDWIQFLDSRVAQHGSVAPPVHGPAIVHLCGSTANECGTLVVVKGGIVAAIEAIKKPDLVEKPDLVANHVLSALEKTQSTAAALDRTQIDARRILDHWLYVNRRHVRSIERRADESIDSFSSRAEDGYNELLTGLEYANSDDLSDDLSNTDDPADFADSVQG